MAIMEMVQRREKLKKEHIKLGMQLFECRLKHNDWSNRTIVQEEDGVFISSEEEDDSDTQQQQQTINSNNNSINTNVVKKRRRRRNTSVMPAQGMYV